MIDNKQNSKINLRLNFNLNNQDIIDKFKKRLIQGGVNILGQSDKGLDIEGNKELLQKALDIIISRKNGEVQIIKTQKSDSEEFESNLHIYAPRPPVLF